MRPVLPIVLLFSIIEPALHVRDFHGRWVLVNEDFSSQEAIVYPGLALYQATAGDVGTTLH